MSYDLDDPSQRRSFRRELSAKGVSEVRHLLATNAYAGKKAKVVAQWLEDVASGATAADELQDVIEALGELRSKFVQGNNLTGMFLKTEDQAAFLRLFMEGRALVDEQLGERNNYTTQLIHTVNSGSGGMVGGPSFACVTEVCELLTAAAKQITRQSLKSPSFGRPAPMPTVPENTRVQDTYVDKTRLDELRAIKSTSLDFRRLIRFCEELNDAWAGQNYCTVAILVRAMMDHVPPVFGQSTFAQVVSQHGSRSFKDSMNHLDKSMRKTGDALLHEPMRAKEVLPTATGVDVKAAVDVLLGEIVRCT